MQPRTPNHYASREARALMLGLAPDYRAIQLGQIQNVDLDLPPGEGEVVTGGQGAGGGAAAAIGGVPGGAPAGTPGAVPVRELNWDLEAQPLALYRLAFGDTLAGLAITYLGNGTRLMEIWNAQTPEYKSKRSPDKIFVDDVIRMPNEARNNMIAFLKLGGGQGDLPGQNPGDLTGDQKKAAKRAGALPWVIGGAAGVGALTLIYYALR
jgi:hypothetical protein